uniref:Fungal-type protein kinase domain-containing protein n=1 Tax=Mycena chlorophos TaxID=658473 RepID=A0ABQ0L9P5_MYCCL|nr:predicted protein [Mycena chlorophos]
MTFSHAHVRFALRPQPPQSIYTHCSFRRVTDSNEEPRVRLPRQTSAAPLNTVRTTAMRRAASGSNAASVSSTNVRSQTPSTPHRVASDDSSGYKKVKKLQENLHDELEGTWVEENGTVFQALLGRMAAQGMGRSEASLNQEIDNWLQVTSLYSTQRGKWSNLPASGAESTLYDPLVSLLMSILKKFRLRRHAVDDGTVLGNRSFVNTHNVPLAHNPHDSPDGKPLSSMPDMLLMGSGPSATSFVKVPGPNGLGYDHDIAIWECKPDDTFGASQQDQIAVYARETFVAQPNRRFVFAAMVSFTGIRVMRFDRGGCYYTRCIDYHTNAALFVKIVLALSCYDEKLLGYDTSIYWEHGQRKMRFTPNHILSHDGETLAPNSTELVFDLEDKPLFARRTIRSRGTVCWVAVYNDGETERELIVKDYWRAADRKPESAFLRKLVGVPGVAQLVTFVDNIESVCGGRGVTQIVSSDGTPITNRFLMRVVIPLYGDTLEKAPTALELLYAVRDIVFGHRTSVLEYRILHRDISHTNLRLSPYHDRERGVLIDWDLAKWLDGQKMTEHDLRTGTRAYQSYKLLATDLNLDAPDHWDDLESILYVVLNVLCNHDATGAPLPDSKTPKAILAWSNTILESWELAPHKFTFLSQRFSWRITRYPAEAAILRPMLSELKDIFKERVDSVGPADEDVEDDDEDEELPDDQPQPDSGDEPEPEPLSEPDWAAMKTAVNADYERFLEPLNAAITKLEARRDATTDAPLQRVTAPRASAHSTPKRRRGDDDDDQGEQHPTTPDSDSEPARKRQTPNASPAAQPVGSLLLRPNSDAASPIQPSVRTRNDPASPSSGRARRSTATNKSTRPSGLRSQSNTG